jgi:hypothetical protein
MKVKRFKGVYQVEGMDDRTIKVKQYAHHFSIVVEQFDGTEFIAYEVTKWEVQEHSGFENPDIEDCINYVSFLCRELEYSKEYPTVREDAIDHLRHCAPELFFYGMRNSYDLTILIKGNEFEIYHDWNMVRIGNRIYKDGWNEGNDAMYEYLPNWYGRHLETPELSNCFVFEQVDEDLIRVKNKDYNLYKAEKRREKILLALNK